MDLILFHGSDHIIRKPMYGIGKTYNDYGRGFYCTETADLAKEWAVKDNKDGYINCYRIEDDDLSVLNLNSKEYTILHWLTLLLKNRDFQVRTPLANEAKSYLLSEFSVETEGYDLIQGYRADDSYFSFAKDFINGLISLRQLESAMRLGKLGEQIMVQSPKAFESLIFESYEMVESREWYPKRSQRDSAARDAYFSMDKNKYIRGDIYMIRILDEEMKSNDPRLS